MDNLLAPPQAHLFILEAFLTTVAKAYGRALVGSTSFGRASALALDLVATHLPGTTMMYIDTGDWPRGQHRFAEEMRERFAGKLCFREYRSHLSVDQMRIHYGDLLTQGDAGRTKYNRIRKLEPFERALRQLEARAVIHGVRAYQNENRKTLTEIDLRPDGIARLYPLLRWSPEMVADYLVTHRLPYYAVPSEKGFASFEEIVEVESLGDKVECGLHVRPIGK